MAGKKKPGDDKASAAEYPIFAFRVSTDEKKRLMREVARVKERLNQPLDEGAKIQWLKNDVIVDALKLGLRELMKGRRA